MRFNEAVRRLTGFSTPIFGVSWDPSEAEVTAARRILAFLEDRRVLYSPYELEVPQHCVDSVMQIRDFLTREIGIVEGNDAFVSNLRGMRSACRKFLDCANAIHSQSFYVPQGIERWRFDVAIGELRGVMGIHVGMLAARNGLDIEDDLASILPGAERDNGDASGH